MKLFKDKIYYLSILGFFALISIISSTSQNRIEKANGLGYDGIHYHKLAEQILQGETISSVKPFCYRVGTPFLSSLLPFETITNFFITNQIATILSCFLLFFWFSFFIKNKQVNLILTLYLMSSWIFYIRFNHFYPVSCDPMAFLFIVVFLILLEYIKKDFSVMKLSLFGLITFLSVFFREFLLIFSFGLLFLNNPLNKNYLIYLNIGSIRKELKIFIAIFLMAILGIYISHTLVEPIPSGYSFSGALYRWLHEKSIVMYFTSAGNSIGIWFLIPLFFFNRTRFFLNQNQHLLVILVIGLIISYITGGETERFFIWFSPIILLCIGVCIESNLHYFKSPLILLPLVLISILSLRIFQAIPQPQSDNTKFIIPVFETFQWNYLDLFSYYANKKLMTIVFLEYLISGVYFFLAFRYLRFRNL
jgi:hypothetical protein